MKTLETTGITPGLQLNRKQHTASVLRLVRKAVPIVCLIVIFWDHLVRQHSWDTNATAVGLAANLSRSTDCSASGSLEDDSFHWTDGILPKPPTAYLHIAASAYGVPGVSSPQIVNWGRDPRFLAWFRAQELIRRREYSASLPLLREAQAGPLILASVHRMYSQSEYSCFLFYALVAQEIDSTLPTGDPIPFAQYLIVSGQATQAADGYSKALGFHPERIDWRIMHARALLALGRVGDAEVTLQALSMAPSQDRAVAETLLGEYYQKSGRSQPALRHFRLAAELQPDAPEYTLRVARLLVMQDQLQEAARTLDAYLLRHPDQEQIRAMRRTLIP